MKRPLRGLYAVTDGRRGAARHHAVASALRGGAALVQYRDKSDEWERRRHEAAALVALCRRHGVPLIVNDDVELALEVGADGVHLGRDDTTPGEARHLLGSKAIIGVSCYNDLERASHFHEEGVDYLAFGAFFPSPTKPNAPRADLDLLAEAHRRFDKPLACIGGITLEQAPALVQSGASLVAVISGLFGADDIEGTAARFAALF